MGDSVMGPAWGDPQDRSLTPGSAAKTELTITRKEALEAAGDLFQKLGKYRQYNQGDLRSAMKEWLTEERIMVMPDDTKDKIYSWCSTYDAQWLTFIASSTEDLTCHNYVLEDQVTGTMKDQGRQIRAVAQGTKEPHTRRALLTIAKQSDDAAPPACSSGSECKEQVQSMLEGMRTSRIHDQELVDSLRRALNKNRELTSYMESMVEELWETQAQQQDITLSMEESRDFHIKMSQSLKDAVKELKAVKEPAQVGRKRARVEDAAAVSRANNSFISQLNSTSVPQVDNVSRIGNAAVPRVDSTSAPRTDNTSAPRIDNIARAHNAPVARTRRGASVEQMMDMSLLASRNQEGYPMQAIVRLAKSIMSEEQFRQFSNEHRVEGHQENGTVLTAAGPRPSVESQPTSPSSEDTQDFILKNACW